MVLYKESQMERKSFAATFTGMLNSVWVIDLSRVVIGETR
jgi:hypothetical protein